MILNVVFIEVYSEIMNHYENNRRNLEENIEEKFLIYTKKINDKIFEEMI